MSINPNLMPGQQLTDLPSIGNRRRPLEQNRTFYRTNLLETTLRGPTVPQLTTGRTQLTVLALGNLRRENPLRTWQNTLLPEQHSPFIDPRTFQPSPYDWQVTRRDYPNSLRAWTSTLLDTTLAPPPFVAVADLPPGNQSTYLPAGRPRSQLGRTRGGVSFEQTLLPALNPDAAAAVTFSFQPTPFDWQITRPLRPTYSWTSTLLDTTLAPVDAALPGTQITGRTVLPTLRLTYQQPQNRLPLTPVDQYLPGEQFTALPPQRQYPSSLRTWTWTDTVLLTPTAAVVGDTNIYQPAPFDWQTTRKTGRIPWEQPRNTTLLTTAAVVVTAQPFRPALWPLALRPPAFRWQSPVNLTLLTSTPAAVVDTNVYQPRPFDWQTTRRIGRAPWDQPRNLGLLSAAGAAVVVTTSVDQPRPFEWQWTARAGKVRWDQPQNLLPLTTVSETYQLRDPIFTPRYVPAPLRWVQPPNVTLLYQSPFTTPPLSADQPRPFQWEWTARAVKVKWEQYPNRLPGLLTSVGGDDASLPQRNLYVWTVPLGARPAYPNSLRSWISYIAPLSGQSDPALTTTYQFQPIPWPLPKVAYVQVKWTQPQNLLAGLLNEPGEAPITPSTPPEQPFTSGFGGNEEEYIIWWRRRHRREELLRQLREELLKREAESVAQQPRKQIERAVRVIDQITEETVAPDVLAELLMAAQSAYTTAQVIRAAKDTYRVVKAALDEADDEETLTWLL